MNVYIASSPANRDAAAALAVRLRAIDLTLTSRWYDEPALDATATASDAIARIASGESADLGRADALVFIAHEASGVALVELGHALGAGLRVVMVGAVRPADDVGQHKRLEWVDDLDGVIDVMQRWSGRGRPR